eukprot:TRINITY_DN6697_c0_g1_i7.p1 TRINITY_DN6697_c0_g1~~TRINITY_DN6697_c0_g1_i7.p1  ORF type:complete len:208 (-),score=45.97 TRINITY_DN6697_c0_g1_i7:89-712(-)
MCIRDSSRSAASSLFVSTNPNSRSAAVTPKSGLPSSPYAATYSDLLMLPSLFVSTLSNSQTTPLSRPYAFSNSLRDMLSSLFVSTNPNSRSAAVTPKSGLPSSPYAATYSDLLMLPSLFVSTLSNSAPLSGPYAFSNSLRDMPSSLFVSTNPNSRSAAVTPESGLPSSPYAATYSDLSLIHISEPTRLLSISYAVFCLKKKKKKKKK